MGWMDYYKLLEKYNGDLNRASGVEMQEAARVNPNGPLRAQALAVKKYWEKTRGVKKAR